MLEMSMQVGDSIVWERTFTHEDVKRFGELSGDQGVHHMEADAQGRLMVQGLLTATLPTKIGGDMNFIGREMRFEFLRPVFTGDPIRCEVTVAEITPENGRLRITTTVVCSNQHGKQVLTGTIHGFVLTA